MKNPETPIEALINRDDGSRIWHTRVRAQLQPETGGGFMIWLGESSDKNRLRENPLIAQSLKNPQLHALFTPSRYFRNPLLKITLDPETGQQTHWGGNCGEKFLGIAKLPLPEDKLSPQSRWRGWTHLSHWFKKYEGLPPIEALFDFLTGSLTSYPKDHTDLSRQIIEEFKIKPQDLKPGVLHHYLPWLNPLLNPDN